MLVRIGGFLIDYFFPQVSTNGILSFGRPFPQHSPHFFSEASFYDYLVAPFWSDNDITGGVGEVSYQVHEDNQSESLSWISTYISQQQQINFNGNWMLIAEWTNVPEYLREKSFVSSNKCRLQ